MDRREFLGLIGAIAVFQCPAAFAGDIGLRSRLAAYSVDRQDDATSLVINLIGKVPYHLFTLGSPPRVVLDLDGVQPRMPNSHLNFSGTPIKDFRWAAHGNGMRLVLDMHHAVQPRARLLDGPQAGHSQLVIEIPHARVALASATGVLSDDSTRRRHVVSIDAGHGGRDPGAISASDHYEKYVAFDIASKLHGLLKESPDFQPMMTRSSDIFLPLRERVLIAYQQKADIFMSIHADAAPEHYARGASVWMLSEHGTGSAMARFLAESENSADRYESLRQSAIYSSNKQLSEILVDMSMDATRRYSHDLGHILLQNLGENIRLHQRDVDRAAFAVLKTPDIPSVLVETGFMSNPGDCRLLLTDRHQDVVAESLAAGVKQYFSTMVV